MKSKFLRNQFIEILSEKPFLNFACKKTGISRATVYRWLKDIPEFKDAVESALKLGRNNVGEMAEAGLVKMINDGSFKAIKYYLDNNDSRYMPKRTVFIPHVKHKHNLEPGETCPECGKQEPMPHSFEDQKKFQKLWSSNEYTREMYDKYLEEFFSKSPRRRKLWEEMKSRRKLTKDT